MPRSDTKANCRRAAALLARPFVFRRQSMYVRLLVGPQSHSRQSERKIFLPPCKQRLIKGRNPPPCAAYFAAPRDQDIDRAPNPVIRQQLGCSKARFQLEVVGNDQLYGLESVAGGGFHVDPKDLADRAGRPADPQKNARRLNVSM
jgi:hypothetical protein